MSSENSRRRITRRQLLAFSFGATTFVAGGAGYGVGSEALAQEEDWRAAAAANDEFLERHAGLLKNVALGASFSPEQWPADVQATAAPAALDWAVRELGIRDLRIGLRWSAVEARRNEIDLVQYRPYLDYVFERRLNLCLNVGPIRVFRWPEEHLPPWLVEDVQLPPRVSRLSADAPLARRGLDYLERLQEALASAYGRDLLSSLRIVQLENEPFFPLGAHEWVMGRDYLTSLVRLGDELFPTSKLLLTTAGRLNIGPVRDVFGRLLAESTRFNGRFLMGFDYHYKTPRRDSIPLVRHLDPIAFARLGQESCGENRTMARALGYGIEVSEAQAEPYAYLTMPGNSARHFRFVLLRCAKRVLMRGVPSVIRIWGIEELSKKAISGSPTAEHRAIFDLVSRINGGQLDRQRGG